MTSLQLIDIIKLFYNFEPSRLKYFELIRCIHPYHMAALIYLIENISKHKNSKCYTLPIVSNEIIPSNKLIEFYDKVTFNLERVIIPIDNNFKFKSSATIPYKHDNIIEFLNKLKNNENCLNNLERIILHNLSTIQYNRFIQHLKCYMFPDYIQSNRNEIETFDLRSLTEKFLQFYNCLTSNDIQNKSPKQANLIQSLETGKSSQRDLEINSNHFKITCLLKYIYYNLLIASIIIIILIILLNFLQSNMRLYNTFQQISI